MNDTTEDISLSPGETTPPPVEEDTSMPMSAKLEARQGSGYYIQKDALVLPESTLTRHATPLPTDLIKTEKTEVESTLNAIQEEKDNEDKNLEAILLNTPYGGKKGQAIAQALEFSSSITEEQKENVE